MPVDFWTKAPWNYKQKEQISLLKRLRAQLEPGEEEPPPEETEALALANIPGRAKMFPGQPPVEPSLLKAIRLAQQPTGLFAPIKRPITGPVVREGFRAGPSPLLETPKAVGRAALTAREAIGQRAVEARRGAGVLGREWVAPAFEPFAVAGKEATTNLFNLVRSLQSLAPGGARPTYYEAEGRPPISAEEAEERLKATGVTPWLTVPVSEAITFLTIPGGVYLPYDVAQLAKLTARLATAGYQLVARGAGKYGAELLEREAGFAKLPGKGVGKKGAKGIAKAEAEEVAKAEVRRQAEIYKLHPVEAPQPDLLPFYKQARESAVREGNAADVAFFDRQIEKLETLTAPALEAVAPGVAKAPAEASLEQYLRKYPWMADEVARARTETEAAYVADKMKEARASVEELGARLAPGQREIFIKEYRKYNALSEAPTEAKVAPTPAAPVVGVTPKVAKEPWEMTREEYLYSQPAKIRGGVGYTEEHKVLVSNALSEGKPVSPEVLKDYPDLAVGMAKAPAEAIKPPVEAPGAIPKAEVVAPGGVPPAGPTVPPAGTVNPLATPGPRAQPIKVPEVRQAPEILAGVRATYPRRLKAPAPQGVKLREARQLQTNAQEVGRNSEAFLLARLTETGSPVELFGIQAGKVTKVGNPNKLNTAWGDVYENYTKYDLTPEQSQLVETFHRIEDGLKAEAARHGVNIAELTPLDALWHYTARKVTGKGAPKADNIIRVSGKSLGGKESFQKQRVFQFMEEGLAKGFTYADPSETMQAIIGGYYRLIGDKMALEHLRPLGLRMAKGQGPRYGELTTRQPGLMGYKFPEEIAREIDDLFTPEKVNRWVNLTAKAFSPFIPLKAALDASWFAIQGALPISHSILKGKPQVAGRVIAGATKALINPKTMNVFRRNHILTYNEALPYNLITGETEFFEALGPLGKKIGQAPVVGRVLARGIKETYGRGAAMFDAASEQYRIIGWETYKDAWVKGGGTLDQLADFLNIMSGTMSSKLAGVSATRQAVERLPAFAPRFYRANFMVLNHLFDGTKTAREVAKGLGALFGLAYLQHITTSLVTDQPLKLDPRPKSLGGNGGEWLTNEVGGQNVGLGGFMLGLGRLMATVGAVAADEPTRLVSLERRANPVLNWLRGKVHPVIGFTNEVATGKDFAGNELRGAKDYMTQIFSLGIPIAIESILFDKPRPGPGAIAVNVAGGRVFPVDLKDAMARSMFEGKDFRDLTPSEMGQLRQTPGWEMLVKEGKMPSETREREETRLDTLKQMETIDRWAKAGVREDNGQAFSMKDWRDEYYKLLTAKAIASETTWRLRGGYEQKPKNENEKARQGYYDTIKKVQDKAKSKGFPVDPQEITDKLDDYLATLTPEREAWVLDQLGASDTPIGREFRKDKRLIKQAYWKPLEGFEVQWQGKEIAMNQALIAKAGGDLEIFNRISAQYNLKGYAKAKKNFRLRLKMQSPELDRLLVKWGYYEVYAHPVNKALQRQGAFVGQRELAPVGAR